MSISALFGTTVGLVKPITYLPSSSSSSSPSLAPGYAGPLLIECSSRPQKKGTKHHMKTRPKKTAAWDVKRGPAVYPKLPPLPPDWSLNTSESTTESVIVEASPVESTEG